SSSLSTLVSSSFIWKSSGGSTDSHNDGFCWLLLSIRSIGVVSFALSLPASITYYHDRLFQGELANTCCEANSGLKPCGTLGALFLFAPLNLVPLGSFTKSHSAETTPCSSHLVLNSHSKLFSICFPLKGDYKPCLKTPSAVRRSRIWE